jgi:hypothetical protein
MTLLICLGMATGAVGAARGALPGDQLYPLKRTVEETRLALTASGQARSYYQERLAEARRGEARHILQLGRQAVVAFEGRLQAVLDDVWVLDNLPVHVSSAIWPGPRPAVDSLIRVEAQAARGQLVARWVQVVEAPPPVPTPNPSPTALPTSTLTPPPSLTPVPTPSATATGVATPTTSPSPTATTAPAAPITNDVTPTDPAEVTPESQPTETPHAEGEPATAQPTHVESPREATETPVVTLTATERPEEHPTPQATERPEEHPTVEATEPRHEKATSVPEATEQPEEHPTAEATEPRDGEKTPAPGEHHPEPETTPEDRRRR